MKTKLLLLLMILTIFATSVAASSFYIDELLLSLENDDISLENGDEWSESNRAGERISADVNVCNEFEYDIRDAELDAVIYKLDDGSDFDLEDSDYFDIDRGDCDLIELVFENNNRIPFKIDDRRIYEMNISLKGHLEDTNNTVVKTDPFSVKLNLYQSKKDMILSKVQVKDKVMQCYGENKIDYRLMNTGEDALDNAEVLLKNKQLGIELKNYHSIKGEGEDEQSGSFTFTLPEESRFDGKFYFQLIPNAAPSKFGLENDRTIGVLMEVEGCGLDYAEWKAQKENDLPELPEDNSNEDTEQDDDDQTNVDTADSNDDVNENAHDSTQETNQQADDLNDSADATADESNIQTKTDVENVVDSDDNAQDSNSFNIDELIEQRNKVDDNTNLKLFLMIGIAFCLFIALILVLYLIVK